MNAQFITERSPSGLSELRIPPHDITAEQAVLGALMIAPDSLAKISDWLTEADFYRADHRMIYRAVTTLIDRGAPVDAVTMMDWFESAGLADQLGGVEYLIDLNTATASAANIVAYAEIVSQKSRLRSAIDAGNRLADSAWKRGADAEQVISVATHELAQMHASKLRGGLEPAKVGMRRMQAELMERYKRGPALLGQPWPWDELNHCTKGLRDSTLIIVGARPSMGKSIFGLQVAVNNAMNGNNTAFFSVEMSADECMARAVAQVGEIPHEWVESPNDKDMDADFYWSRLSSATQRIIEAPLLIDETPSITGTQLKARARRAHMQKPLRLIVVDHMHDMKIDAKQARFEYGQIAQDGKDLAKEFKCPVIMLAQLNRQSANRTDRRPNMTDLRESGEIEQKGDVILFLHREDYYDKDSHMKGLIEVIPAKGRNIKTGENILLKNVFSEMRMDNWTGAWPEEVPGESKGKDKRGMK